MSIESIEYAQGAQKDAFEFQFAKLAAETRQRYTDENPSERHIGVYEFFGFIASTLSDAIAQSALRNPEQHADSSPWYVRFTLPKDGNVYADDKKTAFVDHASTVAILEVNQDASRFVRFARD